MACLAEIERLIFAYAETHGADWIALIPGGIHYGRAPDCAVGQSPKKPYCVWNWIAPEDIRTASELRDREHIQFRFYGDKSDRALINEITEKCSDLFGASFCDLKDLDPAYPDLRMRKGDPPYIAASYDEDDRSRFAPMASMAQFYIDVTKSLE